MNTPVGDPFTEVFLTDHRDLASRFDLVLLYASPLPRIVQLLTALQGRLIGRYLEAIVSSRRIGKWLISKGTACFSVHTFA